MRLILTVGTCASFLPGLRLILERKRHFELFVGCFQIVSAVMYSAADALGFRLLLSSNDWHQISDVLTETYVCLLGIHLMGLRNEDTMHILRLCRLLAQSDGQNIERTVF